MVDHFRFSQKNIFNVILLFINCFWYKTTKRLKIMYEILPKNYRYVVYLPILNIYYVFIMLISINNR